MHIRRVFLQLGLAGLLTVLGLPSLAERDEDAEQCRTARTPTECKLALPACERVRADLARFANSPQLVEAPTSRILGFTTACEVRVGRYPEAEGHLRSELALSQRLHGAEHPDVAGRLHILAYVLRHQGKDEQTEALLRQALAILYLLLTAWLLRNLIETRQS
jgi:hypothetical protein